IIRESEAVLNVPHNRALTFKQRNTSDEPLHATFWRQDAINVRIFFQSCKSTEVDSDWARLTK
ncbi:hypothetical protein, partial [Lacticaseibacillus paracasei]|uniref:hypothetical protein n=1 Tax=Lacticaseibacillus paracasei TaxID=1597 RepID=UPI001E633ED1